nr:MAG: putative structural protein [Hubei sediment hepe-like virus 6]
MSTSIGNVSGVSIEAGTPAGAAYVSKVTHPPTPLTNDYQGRPDCSQPNVVLLEVKAEVNIPPVLTFANSSSTTVTQNPSSMLFLQASGGIVSNYVFHLASSFPGAISNGWVQPQSGTTPVVSQVCPPCVTNAGYNFANWPNDSASFRQVYKSSTYYLNATNFNNQGTVTTAKFKPNIVTANSAQAFFELFGGCKQSEASARTALAASLEYHGVTKKSRHEPEYDFADLATSAAYSYQMLDFGRNTGTISVGTNNINMYINNVMPLTASQLLTFSPKSATRPAKDGAFVVQQQVDPTLDWISTTDTISSIASNPTGLCLSFYRVWDGPSNTWLVAPLYSSTGGGSPRSADIQWGNLDWSYTLFEGLTVPTTVGTTLTSVPYITVKSFTGLEVQVQPASSLVSFQKCLPLPDPDALNLAVGIMHARPDSLPASANDLGSIASLIVRYLPTALEWAKRLFGKSKRPQVNQNSTTPQRPRVGTPRERPAGRLPRKESKTGRKNGEMKQIANLTKKVDGIARNVAKGESPATQLPSYTSEPLPRRNKKRVPWLNPKQ